MSKKRGPGRAKHHIPPLTFDEYEILLKNIEDTRDSRGRKRERNYKKLSNILVGIECSCCHEYKPTSDFTLQDIKQLSFSSYCYKCQDYKRACKSSITTRAAEIKNRGNRFGIPVDENIEELINELWIPYQNGVAICPYFGERMYLDRQYYADDNWRWTVDRISPELGYVENNIQLLSNIANKMKQDQSELQFFQRCVLVVNKLQRKFKFSI